jgi:hypothetical protein
VKEHERAERRRREHGKRGELLFEGCSSRALDEQAERLHDVPELARVARPVVSARTPRQAVVFALAREEY